MQFFYDKAGSSLDIRDLQCPSASRCIAAGSIEDKKGHSKGAVVLTSDSGKNWSLSEVNEQPISLFFLDDSLGWMVTDRGVWTTNESGRTWKKLPGLKKGILQVYFLNPSHGFAIGFPKAVYETTDAGQHWAKVAAAERPATDREDTVYECISFDGQHGIIAGNVSQPGDDAEVWINPAEARLHKERQSKLVILETRDGGATWESYISVLYGKMSQLVMSKEGFAVAIFEYHNLYSLPSRVYKVKFRHQHGHHLRRARPRGGGHRATSGRRRMLAAIEPPGASNQVPIPGKLKMLKSSNLKVWEEMPVDYRAVAQRATLAAPDGQHLWVATDTGMILALDKSQ